MLTGVLPLFSALYCHTGGVVLDDVPRSAVERQQDHDQKGVQAAARSAARAKQQLQVRQVLRVCPVLLLVFWPCSLVCKQQHDLLHMQSSSCRWGVVASVTYLHF